MLHFQNLMVVASFHVDAIFNEILLRTPFSTTCGGAYPGAFSGTAC